MSRDREILKALAECLDPEKVMGRFAVSARELKKILERAAEALEQNPAPPSSTEGEECFVIYTDGASRGNPGPAGAGFEIYRAGKLVEAQARYLGEATNNQAEYHALLLALQRAKELGAGKVKVLTDSELMARQMNGEYKVKSKKIMPLFLKAINLSREFESFEIKAVEREKNRRADLLANRAIDEFQNEP